MYREHWARLCRRSTPSFSRARGCACYGGTTNHFGFWARPEEAADLQPRPGYRDAFWPIDIAELNRYYPDANTFGNFGAFNYNDIAFWSKALHSQPFPAQPDDETQERHLSWTIRPDQQLQVHYGDDLAAQNLTVLFNANALTIDVTAQKSM